MEQMRWRAKYFRNNANGRAVCADGLDAIAIEYAERGSWHWMKNKGTEVKGRERFL